MYKYTFLHTSGVKLSINSKDCETARSVAGSVAKDCNINNPDDLALIYVEQI